MGNSGRPISVLHVDDEPDFADMAGEFLTQQSDTMSVRTETSPREALSRLRGNGFDCVVSDYDMPGMDGIEFLETVRAAFPDLPFILYTGKGSEEVASRAISCGVTDYLQKQTGTSQYELLVQRIENAVEAHRRHEHIARQKQQYQQLFKEAPVMYAVTTDRAGEPYIVECNQRFTSQLGYDRNEIIGEPLADFYTIESTDALLDGGGYNRALSGEFTTARRDFVTADGDVIETILRAVPRADEDGHVIGTLTLYVTLADTLIEA